MMGDPVKVKQVIVRNVQPASLPLALTAPVFPLAAPKKLIRDAALRAYQARSIAGSLTNR